MWRDGKGPWQMEGWFGHFACGLFLECSGGPTNERPRCSGLRPKNICLFIDQHSDLVF